MVAAESMLLCVAAAALGLGIAATLFPLLVGGLGVPLAPVPSRVFALGLAVAAVLGLLIAVLPARRAMRLTIIDAIAGR